ncbi:MAG: hypothetical protein R3F59_29300 [Myxococcota bacterium]
MLPVLFALPIGCSPSYTDVQRIDTIEAYEAFLEADPDSAYRNPVEKRLDELWWDRAVQQDSLEGWAAFTERWEGSKAKHYPEALAKHAEFAWNAAVADGSEGAVQAYVDKFGKANQVLAGRARGWLDAVHYGGLELSAPRVEKVNLAEDPEGPLNGWGVSVDAKNTGKDTLYYVRLSVQWQKPDGTPIETKDYPLVSDNWTMPATEEQQTPIKPGESRVWQWTEDFGVVAESPEPKAVVFPSGLRTTPKE